MYAIRDSRMLIGSHKDAVSSVEVLHALQGLVSSVLRVRQASGSARARVAKAATADTGAPITVTV